MLQVSDGRCLHCNVGVYCCVVMLYRWRRGRSSVEGRNIVGDLAVILVLVSLPNKFRTFE